MWYVRPAKPQISLRICGFMLLDVGTTKNIFTVFLKGNINSVLEWGYPYSKFSFGEVYRRIYVRKSRFTAPLTLQRYTFPNEKFEYSYILNERMNHSQSIYEFSFEK